MILRITVSFVFSFFCFFLNLVLIKFLYKKEQEQWHKKLPETRLGGSKSHVLQQNDNSKNWMPKYSNAWKK
jgi:hypothetical protein